MAEEVKDGPNVVFKHTMTKGLEVGSIVSVLLITVRTALSTPNRPLWSLARIAKAGPFLGAAASGALAYNTMQKRPGPPGEVDRAYRIQQNRQQNRIDQWALHGAAAGIPLLLMTPNGIAFGTVLGLVGAVAERQLNPKRAAEGEDYPPWQLIDYVEKYRK